MSKRRDGFFRRGRILWTRDPVTKKQATTRCTSLEAAKRWRAERELMAVDPAYARSKTETLGVWADKLMDLSKGGSEATRRHDASKVKAILGVIDRDTLLATIDAGTFDDYVIARRNQRYKHKKSAPGDYTIRRELNMLVRILKLAKRGGAYNVDIEALIPMTLISTGRYVPRQRTLTEREIELFLEKLPNVRWRALALIIVAVGCRFSEAAKLERRDVDMKRALVYLKGTKTERAERELPILKCYRHLLQAALQYMPIGRISNVDRTFKATVKRAGIDRCSPNDLRRTHSTLLGERGLDENIISRLLGHTTVTLTKRTYNRARATKLQQVAEAHLEQAPPIVIRLPTQQINDSRKQGSKKRR